jgi:hypothetical protein
MRQGTLKTGCQQSYFALPSLVTYFLSISYKEAANGHWCAFQAPPAH